MKKSGLIKHICPNCGAITSNTKNCETCGSLLVRFLDKNFNVSNIPYLDGVEELPGLAKELEYNLNVQKESEEWIATDIYFCKEHSVHYNTKHYLCSILRSKTAMWNDGQKINPHSNDLGICIVISFLKYNKSKCSKVKRKYNKNVENSLDTFKELYSYCLFTEHRTISEEFTVIEYSIDCGSDIIGASRILSEIIQKVFKFGDNIEFEFHTNIGANIEQSRKDMLKKSSLKINWNKLYNLCNFDNIWNIIKYIVTIILIGDLFGWWSILP